MLASSKHHQECDYIAIAFDAHTAVLHADSYKELFAEPTEESELCEENVEWISQNTKLWDQRVVTLLDSLNFSPLLTDPLDIHSVIHVDDGLLFGPSIEILRLLDHLSIQVMMRIVECSRPAVSGPGGSGLVPVVQVVLLHGTSLRGTLLRRTPLRRTAQNFARFFLLPPPISLLLLSGGFLSGIVAAVASRSHCSKGWIRISGGSSSKQGQEQQPQQQQRQMLTKDGNNEDKTCFPDK